MLGILLAIVALVVLGMFWRYVLRGTVIVVGVAVVGAVAVVCLMAGIKLWDELITKPKAVVEATKACASYMREHPNFKPATVNAEFLTLNQAASPCRSPEIR